MALDEVMLFTRQPVLVQNMIPSSNCRLSAFLNYKPIALMIVVMMLLFKTRQYYPGSMKVTRDNIPYYNVSQRTIEILLLVKVVAIHFLNGSWFWLYILYRNKVKLFHNLRYSFSIKRKLKNKELEWVKKYKFAYQYFRMFLRFVFQFTNNSRASVHWKGNMKTGQDKGMN